MKIGIIGGGQLGWMLGEAANKLGHSCRFVDPNSECTAANTGELLQYEFSDKNFVDAFCDGLDVATFEFENVDQSILKKIKSKVPVFPSVDGLIASQDRLVEKDTLNSCGIETANYIAIENADDLKKAGQKLGYPIIVKTRRMGYDGKGQIFIQNESEIPLDSDYSDSIVEQVVPFDFEVSKIACRGKNGETKFYPLTKNKHSNGILRVSHAPLFYSSYDQLNTMANNLVSSLMDHFNYVGILTVEFFVIGEKLVANEIAPRVHNSGHWTLDAQISSQFENHILAICGQDLGPTIPSQFHGMINVIGENPSQDWLSSIKQGKYYSYQKSERPNRKLGHLNFKADSYQELIELTSRLSLTSS